MDVLVVDDDADIRALVREVLEVEGISVVEAPDGATAIEVARREQVEIVVLDLHLPDMNGLQVLSALRVTDPEIVVMMLTGAGDVEDRVLGLASGADDYIVKPFSTRELAARVLALGRRVVREQASVIRQGSLVVDTAAREVTFGDGPVDLTPREFDLLAFLARNPGVVFTREQLLHTVWQSSAKWQDASTVTEHVRRLRIKIEREPNSPVMLVTVRGVGYRFEPDDVEHLPHAPSGARGSDEAIVVVIGTTTQFASDPALELLGARAADVVGHDVFEFIAPASVEAARARQESTAQGRWPRPETIALRRLDGTEVTVLMASTPVTWEGAPASQVTMWPLDEG